MKFTTAALQHHIIQLTHHKLQVTGAALLCNVTVTCTVQIESYQCCNAVHWHVTCTAQIANHHCYAAVIHNATRTLQFSRHQCHIAMPYHSTNCKSPLLHCSNILRNCNEILIPAVRLLQSGLTTGDVSQCHNVTLYVYSGSVTVALLQKLWCVELNYICQWHLTAYLYSLWSKYSCKLHDLINLSVILLQ